MMWVASSKVIESHPFGTGSSQLDANLSSVLNQYSQEDVATHNYNPHNQYIQTLAETGYLGLVLLLGTILLFTIRALKTKNYILLTVVLCLAFNCLFESMLQRESGIVFFVFWICLLGSNKLTQQENHKFLK